MDERGAVDTSWLVGLVCILAVIAIGIWIFQNVNVHG